MRVTREDPATGKREVATTAYLTLVALDKNKRPVAAPPIVPETEEERRRYEHAKLRVQQRKERLKQQL